MVKSNEESMTIRPRKIRVEKSLILLRPKDLKDVKTLQKRLKKVAPDYGPSKIKPNSITEVDLQSLLNSSTDSSSTSDTSRGIVVGSEGTATTANEKDHDAEQQGVVVTSTPKEVIHIPSFRVNEEHEKLDNDEFEAFRLPKSSYLQFEQPIYDLAMEYDLTPDDEVFLKEMLPTMDGWAFERIMAIISRLSIAHNCTVSTSAVLDMCLLCDIPILESDAVAIVEYFTSKLTSSNMSDEEPGIFITNSRSDKIISLENDYLTLFKMRQDFERLRILMEVVRKRELIKLKKVNVELDIIRKKYKI